MRRGRIGGRGRKDADVRTREVQGGGEKKGVEGWKGESRGPIKGWRTE